VLVKVRANPISQNLARKELLLSSNPNQRQNSLQSSITCHKAVPIQATLPSIIEVDGAETGAIPNRALLVPEL